MGPQGIAGPVGPKGDQGPAGADFQVDLDSDFDGVTDWLEVALGYDPTTPNSVPDDLNEDGVPDLFAGPQGPPGPQGPAGPGLTSDTIYNRRVDVVEGSAAVAYCDDQDDIVMNGGCLCGLSPLSSSYPVAASFGRVPKPAGWVCSCLNAANVTALVNCVTVQPVMLPAAAAVE